MSETNFFEEGSPFLSHPLLTQERTLTEIGFVLSMTNVSPGERILDIGCGPGRHSIELARLGYQAVGVDPSAAMIAAARQRAGDIQPAPVFMQAEGEDFDAQQPFEAAICLFTTLGQIKTEKDNRRLVDRAYDLLVPGGTFVVEVPQREGMLAKLVANERLGSGETYTLVERRFDEASGTLNERFQVFGVGGTRTYTLRYTLFSAKELDELLTEAGFNVRAMYGGFDNSPLRPDSRMMIAVADKPRRTNGSLRSVSRRN